jgi:hypothetical protein
MSKIEELEKQLEVAYQEYDEVYDNLPDDLSYLEFQERLKPVSIKVSGISRKIRMIKEPEFEDLPDYGHIMTLKDFVSNVKSGGFIDYDGRGNYVRGDKMSNITIRPSDVEYKTVRKDFDSIIWFNR